MAPRNAPFTDDESQSSEGPWCRLGTIYRLTRHCSPKSSEVVSTKVFTRRRSEPRGRETQGTHFQIGRLTKRSQSDHTVFRCLDSAQGRGIYK
ncbi:hypothetical protein PAXRUDRAFT_827380 [Paxillus rubicundulus Ve08.2h10]|uniref:Uncharacterized protein n=1 Tax=Paxillus rubicundulus Ve08.2h10 TaxID=930991 RepID=A0A0D0E2V1_9AGAM|nr:hypothetical protein PAXRUDRAFT_827380 [Paxillus rubicundulus Ve08.2h10]